MTHLLFFSNKSKVPKYYTSARKQRLTIRILASKLQLLHTVLQVT